VPNYFLLINLFFRSTPNRQDFSPWTCTFGRQENGFHLSRLVLIILLFTFGLPACAQEFIPEQVVFPITDFKPDIKHLITPLTVKFGTGFCLDPDCRFVGTNYHVAAIMGKHVHIKGVFSAHRYLDSDPDDTGAQDIKLEGGSMKYTPAHDLAIYEMQHPLWNLHGIGFDADDLESSTEADIYAYPLDGNPKRRLVRWHGKFLGKTPQGLLAFSYEEGRVRGGASGGIVVDSKTKKIVGVLSGFPEGKDRIALAVPIQELSDFVTRAQPYLQATLFPKTVFISPVAADVYPPYIWHRAQGLSERPVEPPEVVELRTTAQHLADSMRNFTAIQTFAWGHDNEEPYFDDAYETLIVNGSQRWRHPGEKRFYEDILFPPPDTSIIPGTEWSSLPEMVGTELNLKIHEAQDAVMGGRTVHVFQYAANVEDRVCGFRWSFFLRGSTRFYDCHGEVWMDDSGTILRISEALDLPGPWYRYRAVITYGWLEKDGAQYLVPVTIATQAEHKATYWCRGLFTDYAMFGVKARLVLPTDPQRVQQSSLGAQ
jgi:hypothetical protein